MKKSLNILLVLVISLFTGIISVDAIKISAPAEVNAGEKIKVTFTEATISSISEGAYYEFENNLEINIDAD